MTAPICYKVLNADGSACHGGSGVWALPTADTAGAWMPPIADIVPCQRGYHLCEGASDLLQWLGPVLYVAEWRGDRVRHTDKCVVSEARLLARCEHWTERTARLLAASFARDVLPLYEAAYPNDPRVRQCIEAVERFANGEVDRIFLEAARAAARDAARAAARAAAGAAARAAAWAAARDAARDAAWAAAWATARAAQTRNLHETCAPQWRIS